MCLNHQIAAFNQEHASQFADHLIETLNHGALCLMLSIGHRTGLFDTLASLPPATSTEIAESAGLNERYVREWLGAMVAANVVRYDSASCQYALPAEHAAFLARDAAPDNIAVFAQYIGVLGAVEDDIVHCFRHGGGVPYEKFPRFHAVMAEDSGQTVLAALNDHILPLAPEGVARLEAGVDVLDLGCGRGRAIIQMAQRFPRSRFTGYDLSPDAINHARDEAQNLKLVNVRFEVRDLSDFDETAEPAHFDFITTFDAVHDQARPLALLKGIYRSLRPDGIYLMQDIHSTGQVNDSADHPVGTLLYTISCMHCMTVSLAQGGDGLGAMWGREKARELLTAAGFTDIQVHRLDHDFQNDYYIIRK